MNEKYELALNENVKKHIVLGYGQLLDDMEKNSMTIYGNIAYSIESHRAKIDKVSEDIAAYFAEQKALQITREYEESRSFSEKWLKNNALNQRSMEKRREVESGLISGGVQLAIKGGVYVVQKALVWADNRKRNQEFWKLCLCYANSIADNIDGYESMASFLMSIHRRLFGKDCRSFALNGNSDLFMPQTQAEAENAALILYFIYAKKHDMSIYYKSKEEDFKKMMELWTYMGIFGSYAKELVCKFELMEKGNAFEFTSLNRTIQYIHNNLAVAVPSINNSQVRRINNELLKYVPNGDKQLACRSAVGFISNTLISAAASVVGSSTANPLILEAAAVSALSLCGDLNETEVIGNCLR